MTVTKADLIKTVGESLSYKPTESAQIVDQVFEIIKETLESGKQVKVSGFGTFTIRKKRPREGRNPHTGEKIQIPERSVVTFKSSNILREALNRAE